MIDIYANGSVFLGVRIPYHVMLDIMKEDVIKDMDFIELEFEDGGKGAVRKKSIDSFYESAEMEES